MRRRDEAKRKWYYSGSLRSTNLPRVAREAPYNHRHRLSKPSNIVYGVTTMASGKITQADFARARGVSRKTVTQWKKAGLVVLAADGAVDVEASEKLLAGRPNVYRGGKTTASPAPDSNASGVSSAVDNPPDEVETPTNGNGSDVGARLGDISLEKIMQATGWSHAEAVKIKETFLALLRVQEYQQKAGELLPRQQTRLFIIDILLRVRSKLLAMPAATAAPVHALKTVAEVRQRLDDTANDILAELSASELIGPIDWARAQAVLDLMGGQANAH